MADRLTLQSNIMHVDKANSDFRKYALFAGGLDVTRPCLEQYDPFKGGFYRLFMIRKPLFMDNLFHDKFANFKHVLEYGNTSVSGIGDIDVQTTNMTGGYVGRSVDIPTIATDNMNSFTVTTYEFNGLPMREMLWAWINGVMDTQTGLTHYFGLIEEHIAKNDNGTEAGLAKSLAYETAEFIYVVTDQTGWNINYACHLANCFPKNLPGAMFNSTAGQHELGQLQIQFSCTKYESPQINEVAKALLNKYRNLMNVMDFNCKFSVNDVYNTLDPKNKAVDYNGDTGELTDVTGDGTLKGSSANYSNYYRSGSTSNIPTYVSNQVKSIATPVNTGDGTSTAPSAGTPVGENATMNNFINNKKK